MKRDDLLSTQSRRLVRTTEAARYLGVSVPTLWRWARERPNFPRPQRLGPRSSRWDLTDVDAWLALRGER